MRASEFSRLYQDLIGVKFVDGGRDPATGLDCLGVVRAYLGRVRARVPNEAFPVDQIETTEQQAMDWVDGPCSLWWDRIGDNHRDAMLAGDVVFTIATKPPRRPHVSVLVYPALPKLLLSASLRHGVYTVPLDRAISGAEIVGVYRLRYEPMGCARTEAA